jgi:hypothetical protein
VESIPSPLPLVLVQSPVAVGVRGGLFGAEGVVLSRCGIE